MEDAWGDLAAEAGAVLAELIGTPSWTRREPDVVRLLAAGPAHAGDAAGAGAGGAHAEAAVRARLREAHARLTRARERADGPAIAALEADTAAGLRVRVSRLLRAEPAAEGELRELLAALRAPAYAPPARPGGPAAGNTISGGVHGGTVLQIAGSVGSIVCPLPAASPSDQRGVPRQVPPLTCRPVDQKPYLALLDRLGEPDEDGPDIGMVVVDALPGMGKTTLARRWARKRGDRFPDGQLYVDFDELRAEGGEGGDVSAALLCCLKALGVKANFLPDSLADRVDLYRQRTRERRILVVLENVTQPAQVNSLLPYGPGSALLVTSRGKLGELLESGGRPVSLQALDPDSALELLADQCGAQTVAAEHEAAVRLVELCAGVPKALCIAAGRLLNDGGLTLGRLVVELDDEKRRLPGLRLREEHSMSAVLGLSYGDMRPELAAFYRLLGWLPCRTFDAGTAAAATGADAERARLLLGELTRANLVDHVPGGRYRFHDLVRLHARECADEAQSGAALFGEAQSGAAQSGDVGPDRAAPEARRRELVARVVTHYLVLAAWADRTLMPDRLRIADVGALLEQVPNPFATDARPTGIEPLTWLDTERPDLMDVLREAARCELHAQVAALSEAFVALFWHHRYLSDWRESLQLGAASAAAVSDAALEARLRSVLSRPLMDLEQYDDARTELERAVGLAERSGHTVLRASVQEFHGRYLDRFDPERAVTAYRHSLAWNDEAGERRGAAIAAYFLGCALDATGEHAAALVTLHEARQDFLDLRPAADRRMAARAQAAIGAAHENAGDLDQAAEALARAVDALRAEGAHHYEAQALVRLADLAERTGGDRDTVRAHLTRALRIYEEGGSPDAEKLSKRLERFERLDRLGHGTGGAGE